MFSGLHRIHNLFLISIIVFTLLISTLFTYTYLSPDQSYATDDQQNAIREAINLNHEKQFNKVQSDCSNEFRPLFNKLVFIVIDAFRSDFVNSIAKDEIKRRYNFSMPFTEKLIAERRGLSAISRAQTPTVTLPKLKSILSGSTSNFVDILFNLNAAEFGTDNLIKQAINKDKRIVFYGDDTWLQMFNRSLFVRSNETLSFFAKDYTTVDTNVTENMLPELNKTDEWDFLVLHYLGVDHIGHGYGGIDSKLMPAKLIEMDNAIKVIYETLSKLDENYLIFLTGDHGMTDLGNHGGNTAEETNTAVLFFTTNSTYTLNYPNDLKIKIEQTDLCSLLSFYLGLKLPLKSKGKLDLKLINSFGNLNNNNFDRTKLCYLFKNSIQLQRMEGFASANFLNYFLKAIENHSKLIEDNYLNSELIKDAEKAYDHYLTIIQQSILDMRNEDSNSNILVLCIVVDIIIFIVLITYQVFARTFLFKELFSFNQLSIVSIGFVFLNVFSLGSTSFIEMEHLFFNYITSTLVILHGLIIFRERKNINLKTISIYFSVLLCLTISSNLSSLTEFIQLPFESETSQKLVLFSLIGISFFITNNYLNSNLETNSFTKLIHCLIFALIFVFKFDSHHIDLKIIPSLDDYLKAQLVYFLILVKLIMNFIDKNLKKIRNESLPNKLCTSQPNKFNTATAVWILLITLLIKPEHLILIPIQLHLENCIDFICKSETRKDLTTVNQSFIFRIVIYIYLGMCSFVNLGNTNSLSTLDVTAGFIGLNNYNLVIVSLQIICSVYSTLVFWLIRLFDRLNLMNNLTNKKRFLILVFFFAIRLLFLIYNQIVSYILINHLFVWSVITPKLLYEFALTELFELVTIYGILVF